MAPEVDDLIVGHGLAGSLLAGLLDLERSEPIHPEFDVCRKSLWKSLEKD